MAHALQHPHSRRRQPAKQQEVPKPFLHLPRNIDEASQWVAAILLLFGIGLVGYAIFGMDTTSINAPAQLRTYTTYD
ncbi:MAG TPA: hypothetical protein VHP58_01350 [Alphaproteobacteria bacterium]|nr:hypothetical protein [Alphaproteobacteria bacterium]